jgi:uncharacterized membrane protein YccF (DUF307 family)
VLRTIANILWFILAGLWMAIAYVLAGVVACILIITIPFGIAAFRMAGYVIWPFGRTVVRQLGAGTGSLIANVIWVILFGWWLALGQLIGGILLCITIVGIPAGIVSFKLIPLAFAPFGKTIVDTRSLDESATPIVSA